MGRNDRRKSADMGGLGKLIQISGNTFQLRHKVEVFAPHSLVHSAIADQLADHLRRSLTGFADKGFQLEMVLGIEPQGDTVFLAATFTQGRAAALILLLFHGFDFND